MQGIERQLTGTPLLRNALLIASVIIVVLMSVTHRSGGLSAYPPATPDSPIYAAYALAIADGHAYEFNEGDPPTTGSTSHLYPVVLALFLKLGVNGWGIYLLMACVNAAAFLVMVWLTWLIANEVVPRYAWAALLLVLFSPQLLYTIASQSDMGLFMLLAFTAFAACIKGRPRLLGAALLLLPWARPEGVILCALFMLIALVQHLVPRLRKEIRFPLSAAGLAAVGVVSMLVWNVHLTGLVGFDSTHLRSFFATQETGDAIQNSAQTFLEIIREVFFGLTSNFRRYYFLPVLFGLTMIIGLRVRTIHKRETAWLECWWVVSVIGVLGLVSMSGRAMSNMDRYLAWMLPLCILFAVRGFERLEGRERSVRVLPRILCGLMVAYSLYGTVMVMMIYHGRVLSTVQAVAVDSDMAQQLGAVESVGGLGGVLLKYHYPDVRFNNLSGITSPWYRDQVWAVSAFEKLKHEPERQFDAWLIQQKDPWPDSMPHFLGEQLAGDDDHPESLSLYKANWFRFSPHFLLPLDDAIRARLVNKELIGICDVGYLEHEFLNEFTANVDIHSSRRSRSKPGVPKTLPFMQSGIIGTNIVVEVGRLINPGVSMSVRFDPDRDLHLVLRVNARGSVVATSKDGHELLHFSFPEHLLLGVDAGGPFFETEVMLNKQPGHMTEVMLTLPATNLSATSSTLTLWGDHAALAYWFYQ